MLRVALSISLVHRAFTIGKGELRFLRLRAVIQVIVLPRFQVFPLDAYRRV
jgi:hypothetical protein